MILTAGSTLTAGSFLPVLWKSRWYFTLTFYIKILWHFVHNWSLVWPGILPGQAGKNNQEENKKPIRKM